MKLRFAVLSALLVALALPGLMAGPNTVPPAPPAQAKVAPVGVDGSGQALIADPYLNTSPFSSAVPTACTRCRVTPSLGCAGKNEGQMCGKPNQHCSCQTCNAVFECRPNV